MSKVQKIAVLGAGVMGSQIAALLSGRRLDVHLLDIPHPEGPRNKLSDDAVKRLFKQKPPPLYTSSDIQRIRTGNLEDDLDQLRGCDWVIEAVVERLDIKRKLYEKLEHVLGPETMITSNTSGLSVAALMEGRSPEFQRRFLVTHFFNPPRYLKLVEVVPAAHTNEMVMKRIVEFCERELGKGIVYAKDTPNFIANRIGVFHFLDVIHLTEESGWPIEAVDAVLGPATARPKSAIFRTSDMVGLDTLAVVAETVVKQCPDDKSVGRLRIPQFLQKMITKGWTGQKSGQGFYQKDPATQAVRVIDLSTLEYRPKTTFRTPSLGAVRSINDPGERLRKVVFAEDQAGEIAWPAVSRVLVYAAQRIPEIADDIVQIDRALRWGFNWEFGPFETWDALGVKHVVQRLEEDHVEIPLLVQDLLSSGRECFYEWEEGKRSFFDIASKSLREEPGRERFIVLSQLKKDHGVVEKNGSASLIDLGDGIFCCEFHSKMNAVDGDIISMLNRSLDRVEREGIGLLIANQGTHFSAGANILMMLMTAQQKRWEELNAAVCSFQQTMQRLRFSPKPVMAAPFGMTLGGGCEVALAAGRRQAAVEAYIGLVEVGAGVVPAGGGCKNMLLHFEEVCRRRHDPKDKIWFSAEDEGPFPKVRMAFEMIGTARVAGSAFEAKQIGILNPDDGVSLDAEQLIFDAKIHLLEWAVSYAPPKPRDDISLPGRGGKMALMNALREWRNLGLATEYDTVIAEWLAHVLSGGDRPCAYSTTEEHILDLEREAFLSLCGQGKTQERMAHLLKTGKPLRN